ncbi:ALOX5 [Branchiostoma lanceolatum]|uniref:ALOX5 protein n=1 Tax=Branchiostoma lanceolatum TaxID=7740 RepID=A0A8J9Z9J8_BRALA|nr:ALOX5 [Branchiostoma lanceolatum]
MERLVRPGFKKGKYLTTASGKVAGSVQDVWKAFRPFGQGRLKIWNIFDNIEIEAPGNDVRGCIRVMVMPKRKIYSLLSMEPPPPVALQNVYTTVTMTTVGKKETKVKFALYDVYETVAMTTVEKKATEVKFEATFDLSTSHGLSAVQKSQKGVYMSCINGLQQLFPSEVGTLEVVVGSASDLARRNKSLFTANPYVVLAVNDSRPVTTKICCHSPNPDWDERLTVPITSRTKCMIFTIMDRKKVGQDGVMGTAMVSLDELTSNKENRLSLDVQGGGTLNVRLYPKMHDKPREAVEQEDKLVKEIVVPFLAPVFKMELDVIKDEFTNLVIAFMGSGQKYELRRPARIQSHPDVPMEELPAECVPLPAAELFTPAKFGWIFAKIMDFVESQAGLTIRMMEGKGTWNPWEAQLGRYMPVNERLIKEWQTDEEFCRQYLQGTNPMVLTACRDKSGIPAEMFELKGQGKTTLQLMEEKRLFMVDYAPMLAAPKSPGKCFYAPILLMYKEMLPDGDSRLNILGIQLTRHKAKNEVYSPETAKTHPNKYLFAKMHVMVADANVHEFLYHLGFTHIAMEPIVVSLHANLPPDHPIHRLLLPHFKDTIGINHLARHTLVSRVFPLVEPLFAVFPKELKRRGFDESGSDGLNGYFYRDDGFKLWNIYKTYVTGFVDKTYTNDQAVAADQALQRFCQMVEGPGQLHGFPREISTKRLLIDCLTNIIFTVTAQHSSLNLPQYDYYSLVPNRPPNLSQWMPDGPNDMLESTILAALPPPPMTALMIVLVYLLSLKTDTPLIKLSALQDLYPDVHDQFMKQIYCLSEEIKARNEQLETEGKVPYAYLDPDNVAISINA